MAPATVGVLEIGGGPLTCIAIGVSTRSREGGVDPTALPLFKVLLPSLLATIDPNDRRFRYEIRVGYDDDDPWWSIAPQRQTAAALVATHAKGYPLSLNVTAFSSLRGNPCAIWSSLFPQACAEGCEYYYQLNDDVQLVTKGWAEEFTSTLASNSYVPNLGITGPLDTRNRRQMTQSFTHCTHLKIFGYYYPPAFRNWYSDDWATQVYGGNNTFWRRDIEVHNALVPLGPRYRVAYADKAKLASEILLGRRTIAAWVAREHPSAPSFTTTQLHSRRDAIVVLCN